LAANSGPGVKIAEPAHIIELAGEIAGRDLFRPRAIGVIAVIGRARARHCRRAHHVFGIKAKAAPLPVRGEIAIAVIAERGAGDRGVLVQPIAGVVIIGRERRPPDQILPRQRACEGFSEDLTHAITGEVSGDLRPRAVTRRGRSAGQIDGMTADIPARGIGKQRGRAIGVTHALSARLGVIGDGRQTPPRRGAGIAQVRRALFRADHTVQRVIGAPEALMPHDTSSAVHFPKKLSQLALTPIDK